MNGLIIMMGKTHISVGIASSLILCQPKTKAEFISAIIGGAVGGVMSDIDVKIDRSNKFAEKASKDALYGEIIAAVIAAFALIADALSGFNVINRIASNWIPAVVGGVVFVVLTVLGEISTHRDRTHSILALILFTLSVAFIDTEIGIAFFFGYLSHLLIDLLNKSPERLFYPFKKGVCFKVCYADRLGNDLLFAFGAGVTALYTIMLIA